jgi:hypothetical protein
MNIISEYITDKQYAKVYVGIVVIFIFMVIAIGIYGVATGGYWWAALMVVFVPIVTGIVYAITSRVYFYDLGKLGDTAEDVDDVNGYLITGHGACINPSTNGVSYGYVVWAIKFILYQDEVTDADKKRIRNLIWSARDSTIDNIDDALDVIKLIKKINDLTGSAYSITDPSESVKKAVDLWVSRGLIDTDFKHNRLPNNVNVIMNFKSSDMCVTVNEF